MSNILALQKELVPFLRTGDLAQCERVLTAQLAALPRSPFHAILDLSITTAPEAVAETPLIHWPAGFRLCFTLGIAGSPPMMSSVRQCHRSIM
jgi:hypothetical protein